MIKRLSHAGIYVLDYDSAREFYTEKLGFQVRADMKMDGRFRWLTVGPADQPGLEIILMEPGPPQHDAETEKQLREIIAKGVLGMGAWDTDDCRETFRTLSARGVTFLQEPAERPYGIEAVFRDDSGNWFSLTERQEFDESKPWS
ncbi:VOC family protein [Amycolatopsis cihanbeyliensis]|uniref:Catechol 2,3-dioxygenase-like lactoylglutathione lyase family enzyme n=1 Tax=Amycolatopsis cihanbeyliensis TaxID=1128664 RepID=A0A542DEQ7_AMYCI|nr:VOC family protein [Amycolatopsis cihanbeyliensis]TQJ01563.1 catechol 2,3-dioxygenase-like lactoylglutathione lyase family enzyme [Amycolatopsis cihanbeyliensis]